MKIEMRRSGILANSWLVLVRLSGNLSSSLLFSAESQPQLIFVPLNRRIKLLPGLVVVSVSLSASIDFLIRFQVICGISCPFFRYDWLGTLITESSAMRGFSAGFSACLGNLS